MTLQVAGSHALARPASGFLLPTIIADAGDKAAKRFVDFFTATIRNPHARRAYARATARLHPKARWL